MSLTRSTAKSAGWLVVRFGGRQLVNSGTFFVVAAFLTPHELGLASIAIGIAVILRTFLSRGLRDLVVRTDELAAKQLNTAWWLNFSIGASLATGMALAAGPIATAYGEADLAPLIRLSALIPLLVGMSAIQEARLERAFRHKVLTAAQMIASILAAAGAVALALKGAGPWALVTFNVVEVAGITGVTCALARWVPALEFDRYEARRQLHFAWPISLSFSFTTGNVRYAQLIVAAVLGPAAAAQFRVASQVSQLLTQTISAPMIQILLPAFSRITEGHGRQYCRALSAVSAATLPAFLGAAALAPTVVPLVLGEAWKPAGAIAGVLCFAVFPAIIGQVLTPMLIAHGNRWTASRISISGSALSLGATAVGATISLIAAAAGFVARGLITIPANFYAARRHLAAPVGAQILAIFAFGGPAMCMYGVVSAYMAFSPAMIPWVKVGCGAVLGVFVYGALVRWGTRAVLPGNYEPLRAVAPSIIKRFL